MCVVNTFQLWSKGQQHPGQLRFREELMHQLMKQLQSEQAPRKRGSALHPERGLANEHFSTRVHAWTRSAIAQCAVVAPSNASGHISSVLHAKSICALAIVLPSTTRNAVDARCIAVVMDSFAYDVLETE